MGMGFLWESHEKRPMGWDRHKLLWDGNGTNKYVPWTTLSGLRCQDHVSSRLKAKLDKISLLGESGLYRCNPFK